MKFLCLINLVLWLTCLMELIIDFVEEYETKIKTCEECRKLNLNTRKLQSKVDKNIKIISSLNRMFNHSKIM